MSLAQPDSGEGLKLLPIHAEIVAEDANLSQPVVLVDSLARLVLDTRYKTTRFSSQLSQHGSAGVGHAARRAARTFRPFIRHPGRMRRSLAIRTRRYRHRSGSGTEPAETRYHSWRGDCLPRSGAQHFPDLEGALWRNPQAGRRFHLANFRGAQPRDSLAEIWSGARSAIACAALAFDAGACRCRTDHWRCCPGAGSGHSSVPGSRPGCRMGPDDRLADGVRGMGCARRVAGAGSAAFSRIDALRT